MTSSDLAVHSASAQPFNAAEIRLMTAMNRHFGVTVARTLSKAARVDAVWIRQRQCIACSEHKVRTASRALIEQWGGTYLITAQKLTDGVSASKVLGVPFWVVALLLPDAMAYAWQITDPKGEIISPWEEAVSTTQATCEGGFAARMNAFVPFAHAESFPVTLV